jgi:hypothetical protein
MGTGWVWGSELGEESGEFFTPSCYQPWNAACPTAGKLNLSVAAYFEQPENDFVESLRYE